MLWELATKPLLLYPHEPGKALQQGAFQFDKFKITPISSQPIFLTFSLLIGNIAFFCVISIMTATLTN